ncbi:FAD/NAD(P)-binding domain-containing protein [Lindgomyces ingoldianus]|uniref:FAD/NAD(P)-binding domain-containing protein n=1 Tax=Lindgomyces ingoldianus TaxID=673940 RepID=A0ACB6QFY8_9PLEO|nr:FAD/NAD(P)-binding domain-containing protein [Lindgomyces ingoldianus]KAF2465795.1 FAD/NAD(P)-binding domain-containing protein [Lindgomyces ingoldianus]
MHLPKLIDALNTPSPLANLSISSSHRVLVIGAAYGGISTLLNLFDLSQGKVRESAYPLPDFKGQKPENEVEITVIDERDGFFHSVGAPLAHVSKTYTSAMWKRYSQLNELRHPNLHFKHGSVQKIDPEVKIAEYIDRSGQSRRQRYDYLIMATGLKRHWPAVPKSGSYAEYVRDAQVLIDKITGNGRVQEERKVVIIGAGAVGVEFAGEIKANYPSLSVTLVHSRSEVLSSEPLPTEVKERVKLLLGEEGVDLKLGNRASVADLSDGKFLVTLANGENIIADVVLDATKKGSPTTNCLPAECLDDENGIKVNSYLQFSSSIPNALSHFGVGDVITWSGIKRAGGAMVMGQVAATNVYASILNSENVTSKPFQLGELPEYPVVIGIAVGKQCLTYDSKQGVKWGVQLMKDYFQDDLGWAYSLKYLGLTDVDEKGEDASKHTTVEIAEAKRVGPEPVPAAAA